MSKPTIFFDWDGTLCDSMQLCIEENRNTLLAMGLPDQPDAVLRRCNGPTFEEAAPIIGVPADRMEEYCRIRLACALDLVPKVNRLFPGVTQLLDALKDKALLCIVSNGTEAYLSACMEKFRLQGVFHRIAATHPERTKAQNLAALIQELQPRHAVMVGDRIGDIRAGQMNRLPTIAACYGYGNEEEYAHATERIATVEALRDRLLRFCNESQEEA